MRELIVSARQKVQGSIGELRQLGRGLHPAILDDRGIDAALSAVVSGSPIPISVHVDPELGLSTDVAETVYFVVNEAVANVLKHAKARVASVHVMKVAANVRVTVHDDGVGGVDPSRGTGIAGIRARVNAVDGVLGVTSPDGGPTTIIVEIPRHAERRGRQDRNRHGDAPSARSSPTTPCCSATASSGCSPTPASTSSPRSATPMRCSTRSPSTHPICASSTCACRRPTPTRACGPRSRSGAGTRASPCSCCRSTSRSATPVSSWPATRPVSGYLLKDRVIDVGDFVASLRRVAAGAARSTPKWSVRSSAARVAARARRLTPREREVLTLMAEGLSNPGIAERLVVSAGAVEKHISNVFVKLGLEPEDGAHRRVLAVLTYLRGLAGAVMAAASEVGDPFACKNSAAVCGVRRRSRNNTTSSAGWRNSGNDMRGRKRRHRPG